MRISRPVDVLRQLRAAAQVYDTTVWQQVRRLHRLRSRYRFLVDEAIVWGLTDPAIPDRDLDRYPSRVLLNNVKHRVNDPVERPDLADKARFHRLCVARGLPVPPCFGVVRVPGATRRADPESPPADLAALRDGGYVAKPAWGQQGMALVFFAKAGDRFDVDGDVVDAQALRARLERGNAWTSDYVIQQRVLPHPALAALSGGDGLQCVRIVTYVDEARNVHLLFARFKFVDRGNLVDNFDEGSTGNLIGEVDLDTGRVVKAVAKGPADPVVRSVARHPGTGHALDVVLPLWPETVALARSAALAFPRSRCIGWDLAATPSGPVLIEGNRNWDAFPFASYRRPPPDTGWERLLRGDSR